MRITGRLCATVVLAHLIPVTSLAGPISNTTCDVALTGDVNFDGLPTAEDVIYMVNFVFKSGSTPLPCEAAADVNCDTAVTAADIVYFVNYIFKRGPLPCDVCALIPAAWSCNPEPPGRIYVPNQADQTIFVYDSETLQRLDSFPTPVVEPHYIAFAHDLSYYYVVGRQPSGQLAKYRSDDDSLVALVQVEGSVFPTAFALSNDDDTLYLTDYTLDAGRTHRYDASGDHLIWVDSMLQAGHQTHDIRISPDGRYVVSAGYSSDDITVLDLQAGDLFPLTLDSAHVMFNPISNNYGPYGVQIDQTSTMAILACSKGTDQIRLVDLVGRTIVDSILVPVSDSINPARNGPTYMALSPDNDILFVTNYLDNTVSVIRLSTRSVITTLAFATPKPFGIAISADGSRVYVTCTNTRPATGRLYIIDGHTYQKRDSIDVGSEPYGLTWRPL